MSTDARLRYFVEVEASIAADRPHPRARDDAGTLIAAISTGRLFETRVTLFTDDRGRPLVDIRAWQLDGQHGPFATRYGLRVLGAQIPALAAAIARAAEIVNERAKERNRPCRTKIR